MKRLVCLFAVLALAGCVSTKLADANLQSVTALGQVAIDTDAANEPIATDAADNAQAIVEAAAPLQQVLHLGVPTDIVDKNAENVDVLASKVDVSKPAVEVKVKNAKANAATLKDKAHEQQSYRSAIASTDYGALGLKWLTLLGSAVGAIYGATRGQKHVRNWWATPTATIPPKPKPLPSDLVA